MLVMITVGIDEVGRGCWAGPLVAAAVVLPGLQDGPLGLIGPDVILRDSKQMTKKQRETAAVWVHEHALAVGIGWVWPGAIDISGISAAVKRAMEQALTEVEQMLMVAGTTYDEVIVDGNINYLAGNPKAKAVVKADATTLAVSAASIVAKVARDAYMAGLGADARYAGYGFDKHVGYGTAVHIAALRTLGVSDIHRRSFRPVRELLT